MSGRPLGWLTLTHSRRETNLARCSVQLLTWRFSDPARLASSPPFESLGPAPLLYSGAVSFHLVSEDGAGRLRFESRGSVRSRDRIQHAAFLPSGDLLVGFSSPPRAGWSAPSACRGSSTATITTSRRRRTSAGTTFRTNSSPPTSTRPSGTRPAGGRPSPRLHREAFGSWPVDGPGEPPPGWLGNSVQALAFRRIA